MKDIVSRRKCIFQMFFLGCDPFTDNGSFFIQNLQFCTFYRFTGYNICLCKIAFCRLVLYFLFQKDSRKILVFICCINFPDFIIWQISRQMLVFFYIIMSMPQVTFKGKSAFLICRFCFKQRIFFHHNLALRIFDIFPGIQTKHHTLQCFFGYGIFLLHRNLDFLPLILISNTFINNGYCVIFCRKCELLLFRI